MEQKSAFYSHLDEEVASPILDLSSEKKKNIPCWTRDTIPLEPK